jgi:hypothetical protein
MNREKSYNYMNNDLPSGKRKEILLQILESLLPKLSSY